MTAQRAATYKILTAKTRNVLFCQWISQGADFAALQ